MKVNQTSPLDTTFHDHKGNKRQWQEEIRKALLKQNAKEPMNLVIDRITKGEPCTTK